MQCAQCNGGRFEDIRRSVRETIAGIPFAVETPTRRCLKCGERYYSVEMIEAHELAIAAALARLGIRKGEAVQYMRRALGLRAVDFAELLDVTKDTVSRWERDVSPIDPATFAVLGALVHERRAGRTEMLEQLRAVVRAPAKPPTKPIKVVAA